MSRRINVEAVNKQLSSSIHVFKNNNGRKHEAELIDIYLFFHMSKCFLEHNLIRSSLISE